MTTDLYAVLQVRPSAEPEVIEAAYKALMKLYHPDVSRDDAYAKDLNNARDILSDPDKRARYDAERNKLEGKVIGNYRFIRPIAQGGFGTTYEAEHILVHMPVCIKHCSRISPQDEEILIGETNAIWDLPHVSLPVMRDLIRLEDGSVALVMSYIPGPTLEQIVKKVGRLDPETVAWITERVVNTLKYLHYEGVVHGDIKPQNIIIQPEKHKVFIVDFGLAAVKPSAKDGSKGFTPYFAPPEEIAGSPLLPESDFYSLAMTMIYALSGNTDAVDRKRVPTTVPDKLVEFIQRLARTNVLDRPNWQTEDLFETIQRVRTEAFGRSRSGMKPIPGF